MIFQDAQLRYLCNSFSLSSLITEPTCFKSSSPSGIDLILTNRKASFMKCSANETGISDFHKMIMTVFKTTFVKGEHKTIHYRYYNAFDKSSFENELKDKLSNSDVISYDEFYNIFRNTLNKHAPNKQKSPFQQ